MLAEKASIASSLAVRSPIFSSHCGSTKMWHVPQAQLPPQSPSISGIPLEMADCMTDMPGIASTSRLVPLLSTNMILIMSAPLLGVKPDGQGRIAHDRVREHASWLPEDLDALESFHNLLPQHSQLQFRSTISEAAMNAESE
jgi:hypothetical protein